MKKIFVLYDEIAQDSVDCFFSKTREQAEVMVENQIVNLERKLGNRFKYRLKLYECDVFDPKVNAFIKKFERRK